METFTIAAAARHLGVSDTATRKMIGRAELSVLPGSDPARLSAEHVETVRLARRENILHELARRSRTPVHLAREARRTLQPSATLPDHRVAEQRLRLSLVSPEARQLFGAAALTAACAEAGCRWCMASAFARTLGGWAPTVYSEGFAALLGEPCAKCGPALRAPLMAALRARVHGGDRRPSQAAPRPTEAERVAAQEWASRRAVTASARPVDADGGKALVARRLREDRTRLKDAKRRGDQKYALRLRSLVASLEADAARVDGRLSASSRPGTLRCGHQLAAACSCPRRASK